MHPRRGSILLALLAFGLPAAAHARSSEPAAPEFASRLVPLRFAVPAGYGVFERRMFVDRFEAGSRPLVRIRIVPEGLGDESSLGNPLQISIDAVERAPGDGARAPADADRSRVESERPRADRSDRRVRSGSSSTAIDATGAEAGARDESLVSEGGETWRRAILAVPGFTLTVSTASGNDPRAFRSVLASLRFEESGDAGSGAEVEARAVAAVPELRIVYLAPSDRPASDSYRASLDRAARQLQSYYRQQLMSGKTFLLHDPVVEVIPTPHDVLWYTTNAPASSADSRFYESVFSDAVILAGVSYDDPEKRWIIVVDADPFCNQFFGTAGGVTLLPAPVLRGLSCGEVTYPCGGRDPFGVCRWVGEVGHELGHAFELMHPTPGTCPAPDTSCSSALMYSGQFVFPDAYLQPSESITLLTSPTVQQFFVNHDPGTVPSCSTQVNCLSCYSLAAVASPAGFGSVSVTAPTCSSGYTSGSVVSLTATPASSSSLFVGWSGDCAGTSATTSVTMSVNRACYALFTRNSSCDLVGGGSPVARFRLYSPVTGEHHYTTDANEYAVLQAGGWAGEGSTGFVLNGPGSLGGVSALAFYRLYHTGIHQHHWTTDLNEYIVLGQRGWTQEGLDGYLFGAGGCGLVPLYRLSYTNPPLHLWTTDANEAAVLTSRGWAQEGIVGYQMPP